MALPIADLNSFQQLLSEPNRAMKIRIARWLTLSCACLSLSNCTPQNELISRTRCDTAIAEATQTWEVEYYISKTSGGLNSRRLESFASNRLRNLNGEQPAGAIPSPDANGVWWPALPPQPNADEVDARRRTGERNDPPALQRSVAYQLRCEDGTLLTDAPTYREAARAIRAGKTVQVSYSLNRVLKVEDTHAELPNVQSRDRPPLSSPASKPTAQPSATVLFVDPQQGSDRSTGSNDAPFKTITHALRKAGAGTVIQLRSGTYNSASGEAFPLQLQPRVTLRGNPETQGQGILIEGGGKFLSPTWAGQNVTIVAVQGADVEGITLTNPNPRGTAIWVEAGNPTISGNTFVGNHREGVFVSGNATPTVRNNLFERNGGNGISFTRDSGGLVEGNEIRSSGFGLAIGDRAGPKVAQNQITQNLDGILISEAARPTLSQNTITQNDRDGIVVTRDAQPQLQNNQLSQNGQYDLHNATSRPLTMTENDRIGLKIQGPTE